METIKQYLETMFASLPDTTEVQKAKEELLQMMEDKYNELLAEGKSDNEAVGIVIAEFGNLDEVAEELGIRGVMDGEEDSAKAERAAARHVTAEEAEQFLNDKKKDAFKTALGVLLCIYSVIGPVMTDAVFSMREMVGGDAIGVSLMMGMIGAAVCLFVYSSQIMKKWSFLHKEAIYLDFLTKQKVAAKKENYQVPHAMSLTIGIVLCVICFVPAAILSEVEFHFNRVVDLDSLGGAILFVLVGIGVFLIVYANMVSGSFDTLLKNSGTAGTARGTRRYHSGKEKYISPGAEIFMSVYWYSVTCIYLIWSFLTFNWHFTWIVWPVAAVMYAGLSKVLRAEGDDE